jgi:hypothetical protein
MNKAIFIKNLPSWMGDADVYRLEPPYTYVDFDGEETVYEYVIVSAVVATYSGPETYIFPANKDGSVIDWIELDGSFRGGLSHNDALAGIDYEIIEKEQHEQA